MARKKLFGNTRDPRCETCLHGRRSSDGDSVLCQRGGVLPLSHHCRHFQYDPLRRTPNRVRPLEEFEAAEFALDDLSAEWLETVSEEQPSPEDIKHTELMKKLRSYLNETASPNVDDILVLLSETPVTTGDTEVLLAEADAMLGGQPTETSAPTQAPEAEEPPTTYESVTAEPPKATETPTPKAAPAVRKTPETAQIVEEDLSPVEVVPETEAIPEAEVTLRMGEPPAAINFPELKEMLENEGIFVIEGTLDPNDESPVDKDTASAQAQDTPANAENVTVWHPDASPDITGDLETLQVDVVKSSTPAAFRNFDLKFVDRHQPAEERDDIQFEDNDTFTESALLTTPQGSDYDDETLRAEDLIFLSESQFLEEDDSTITMNADGTFTQV